MAYVILPNGSATVPAALDTDKFPLSTLKRVHTHITFHLPAEAFQLIILSTSSNCLGNLGCEKLYQEVIYAFTFKMVMD